MFPGSLRKLLRDCILATVLTGLIVFTSAAAPAPKPQKSSGGKHCLWRVTNTKTPFYLLGSIHALRASDYPPPTVIWNAILQSQQYYFECMDDTFGRKLGAAAYYPNHGFIRAKVQPETFKHLMKITSSGYTWQHMKPWAIAMFVLRHPGFGGVYSEYGMDEYIERVAKKHGRPCHGLETADEHVHVLSDMDDHESEVFLLEALVFGSQEAARYHESVAAWKAGDTKRIADLELPIIQDAPNLNKRLLDWRNAKWIPKIEAAIKSGKPTMVVAGCSHFSGSNNVLSLLRARGYTIEQL